MILFNIISIACITYLFVASEPLILFKRFLGFKEEDYHTYSKYKQFIYRLITCALCSGFWIGFILTFSVYQAAIISIVAEIIYRKLN